MFLNCLAVAITALTPWFLVRYVSKLPIRITDLRVLGGAVLSPSNVEKLSGIHEGDPLFGSWIQGTLQSIKANPRVSNVAVRRNVTGGVTILFDEKKAAALANFDELYFLDREGTVLGPADAKSSESVDFPVMTGPWSGKKPTSGFTDELRDGISLLSTLSERGFPEKSISEIHFDRSVGWVMYRVGKKFRVVMGTSDYERKANRLSRVLKDFEGKENVLREIDLDFGDRAIVKISGKNGSQKKEKQS